MVANDLNSGGEVFMNPENFKMATIVITVFLIICVYPFLQKHFTQGVMMGVCKGLMRRRKRWIQDRISYCL